MVTNIRGRRIIKPISSRGSSSRSPRGRGPLQAVRPTEAAGVVTVLKSQGESPRIIGELIPGDRVVSYLG